MGRFPGILHIALFPAKTILSPEGARWKIFFDQILSREWIL